MQQFIKIVLVAFLFLFPVYAYGHGLSGALLGGVFDTRVGQYNAALGGRFAYRNGPHELDAFLQIGFSSPQNLFAAILDYGIIVYDNDVSEKLSIGFELHFELEYFFSGFGIADQKSHSLELSAGAVFFQLTNQFPP